MGGPRSECLVMAKPAGPLCNMRCGYCYYVGKEFLLRGEPGPMPESLLESYVGQRLEASPGPVTHFEWHGGEPTLLGVGYFKTVVRVQRRLRPRGRKITNGLQTNGLLIDEDWAEFLSREGFSVGLSLDGPADLHDGFRLTAEAGPTHARVVRSFALLKSRGVFCNVLCVLHSGNADKPDRLYDFFRELGVTHLQFLPLTAPNPAAASAGAIGAFLCRVFDRWAGGDVGRVVIQTFDEALRPLCGIPHALCVHRETCGDVAVLERNGDFYMCDHFVDPAHLLGNLKERSLADMAADPRMTAFGLAKRDALPGVCRSCDVLDMCNGGCPKDRTERAPDGGAGWSSLCPAYKRFFGHCRPVLVRLAEHMKAGRPLRAFTA
jgi:uncharacterized protein